MTLAIGASVQDIRNVLVKFGQGAFFATGTTATALASDVAKILTVDTEVIDVCSWFASNTFTPKQPGTYLLMAQATMLNANNTDFTNDTDRWELYIRKNTAMHGTSATAGQKRSTLTVFTLAEANGTTDTFDVYALFDGAGGETAEVTSVAFGGVFVSYNNP